MRYRRDDNLLNEMMTPGMVVVQAVEEEPPVEHEHEHDNSEIHMAKSDLLKAHKYAEKISAMLDGIPDLEGWTASKITKAADYLSSVYHWLDYEHTKDMGGDSMYNMGHENLKSCGCPEDAECPHD